MQSIYQRQPGPLHALHPLTKLVAALLLLAAASLIPWLFAPLAVVAALLITARVGGVLASLLRAALRFLLPITISLFLIQGILFPPPGATPLPLGPITLTVEGLRLAFLTSSRLLALAATLVLVLQTTHPADLIFALTERGLPASVGYILLVSLQLVPDMLSRASAILEAQRSRGLETERGLARARALAPLVGPLVVGALVDVEERAMALESRAYTAPGPKTSLRELRDSRGQRLARWAMLLALGALIAGRIALA